jgi:ribosomal protein S18 acetylase RimI-like enzyme
LTGLEAPLTHGVEGVTLRQAQQSDRELLYGIYASTRTEELAVVPWSDEQKAAFLRMQFDAQDRHYRQHYPEAAYLVIESGGQAAGRLYVHRSEREIRILDVALLPAQRGRGIGGGLLRELLAEGDRDGKVVVLHVELQNPALRLYERLGFKTVEDVGLHYRMERPPASGA